MSDKEAKSEGGAAKPPGDATPPAPAPTGDGRLKHLLAHYMPEGVDVEAELRHVVEYQSADGKTVYDYRPAVQPAVKPEETSQPASEPEATKPEAGTNPSEVVPPAPVLKTPAPAKAPVAAAPTKDPIADAASWDEALDEGNLSDADFLKFAEKQLAKPNTIPVSV